MKSDQNRALNSERKSRRDFLFSLRNISISVAAPSSFWQKTVQTITVFIFGEKLSAQYLKHAIWKNKNVAGTLWSWGLNGHGQLGQQNTSVNSSPVIIGNLRNWAHKHTAGNLHTLTIKANGTLWGLGASTTNGVLGTGNTSNYSSPVQIGVATNWTQISTANAHTLGVQSDGSLWAWGSNSATLGAVGDKSNSTRLAPVRIGLLTNWSEVSAGEGHSLAVKTDGTLWSWGRNTFGQLGFPPPYSPIQIGAATDWLDVSAGSSHVTAVRSGNTLWGWGLNTSYQLGNGVTTNTSSPVQVGASTSDWSKISSGEIHTSAIKTNGTLWAWGSNPTGQLGNNSTTTSSLPVQIGSETDWSKVSAGNSHTVAVRSGTLWAWGGNSRGQLGISFFVPVQLGALTNWRNVFSNFNSSVFHIKSDGRLWAWGNNASGLLGDGTSTTRSSPVQVGTATDWSFITGNVNQFTFGIKTDNTLWAWGSNTYGLYGNGTTTSQTTPLQIGVETNWSVISTGGAFDHQAFAVAVKTDGTLWGWGNNTDRILADGTTIRQSSPVQIGTDTNWSKVSCANQNFVVAMKSNGTIWSWGFTGFGAGYLGQGSSPIGSTPTQIGTDNNWTHIVCSSNSTFAVKTNGTLWAWGYNVDGRLGNGTTAFGVDAPVQIGIATDWTTKISSSTTHTMAIKSDNTLWGWGQNQYGQLGLGDGTTRLVPTQVGADTDWFSVAVGQNYTVATKTNGTVWVWGINNTGQLANPANHSSPVQIGINTNWSKVSAGLSNSLALTTDNKLFGWGANTAGQLGILDAIDRNSPTQIGSNDWADVADVRGRHSLAIKTNGTLWAWGENTLGQLGNNSTTSTSSPVQIGVDTNWSKVCCGLSFSVALKSNGTLWTWGDNSSGMLGLSIETNVSVPTQVGTDTDWAKITAGNFFVVAVKNDNRVYSWGLNSIGELGYDMPNSPIQVGSLTNWSKVSAGINHSVAIKADGTLWAWGPAIVNGDGTMICKYSPVQIGTDTNWSKISTVAHHTLALKTNGTLWVWGSGGTGRLGDGTINDKSAPVQIGLATDWVNIAGGRMHSVAIKANGSIWAWGSNTNGQLGIVSAVNVLSPVQVGKELNWVQISAFNHTVATK